MYSSELQEQGSSKDPILYPAKVIGLPAKWNTFCYIVEFEGHLEKVKSPVYFSESASGKPVNANINDEGFIYTKSLGSESFQIYWLNKNETRENEISIEK